MAGTQDRLTPEKVTERALADFKASDQVQIGAEVEWLVFDPDDPARNISADQTAAIANGPLPAGGTITVEPGGQLELVTVPAPGPGELVEAIDTDTAVLVERFAAQGLSLMSLGLDPIRPAQRTLDQPRYAAMESYFSNRWPAGLVMMTRTASLQLNIDFGPDPAQTWRTAHRMAPLLSATFANSPSTDGVTFAKVSERQRVWAAIDPSRTAPVGEHLDDWCIYVLDAPAMMRTAPNSGAVTKAPPDSFASWLASSDPPTHADLELHLTTLFPPVRPKGFLELRMLDALPRTGQLAAIGTVWTLLTNADVAHSVIERAEDPDDAWRVTLSEGLSSTTLRQRAQHMLTVVAQAMAPEDPELAEACTHWRDGLDDHQTTTRFHPGTSASRISPCQDRRSVAGE